jgi:hypothetical protein
VYLEPFTVQVGPLDDADQVVVAVDYRQTAQTVLGHQLARVLSRVTLETADNLHRHDVTGDSGVGSFALRYRSRRDVPIGDDPNQFIALENRHEADAAATHSPRQLAKRGVRVRGRDAPDEDLTHVHARTRRLAIVVLAPISARRND